MFVNLSDLRNSTTTQTYHFRESCQPLTFGSDLLTLEDPMDVCLNITCAGHSFLVTGAIQAQARVACARCLEDFLYPINLTFEDEWAFAEDLQKRRQDLLGTTGTHAYHKGENRLEDSYTNDNVMDDVFCLVQEKTDVSDRVMEHFFVNLPMRFLCSDDCRGLCPKCGANLNLENPQLVSSNTLICEHCGNPGQDR